MIEPHAFRRNARRDRSSFPPSSASFSDSHTSPKAVLSEHRNPKEERGKAGERLRMQFAYRVRRSTSLDRRVLSFFFFCFSFFYIPAFLILLEIQSWTVFVTQSGLMPLHDGTRRKEFHSTDGIKRCKWKAPSGLLFIKLESTRCYKGARIFLPLRGRNLVPRISLPSDSLRYWIGWSRVPFYWETKCYFINFTAPWIGMIENDQRNVRHILDKNRKWLITRCV